MTQLPETQYDQDHIAAYDVVIVGGGPRGLATLERIDARVRAAQLPPARVAMIDAIELGAGATWRTDQTAQFLNNTTSDATTIYPDSSTPITGPAGVGPTFLTWAEGVAARGEHDLDWVLAEAQEIRPWSFPTRRLQGVYYREQLRDVAARGGAKLTEIVDTVIDVTESAQENGESRIVTLASGAQLEAYTVVLAQGMVQSELTVDEQAFATAAAAHGLNYLAPGMPAEQAWQSVPAGQPVIVRGVGANFFDIVAELTAGRGGSFTPVPGDPNGRLRYEPSGDEPVIWATSPRGMPYRAKGDFQSVEQAPYEPVFATAEWFADLGTGEARSLDFAAQVWPTIAAEFALGWALAQLKRERTAAFAADATGETAAELPSEQLVREFLHRAHELDRGPRVSVVQSSYDAEPVWSVPHIDCALEQLSADWKFTFTIDGLHRPTRGKQLAPSQWAAVVRRYVESELDSLSNPLDSPRQTVNRAMAAIRGNVAKLAAKGVFTNESQSRDLAGWWNSDSLFMASGPPASRVRQALALIEAGVLNLIGPEPEVRFDALTELFVATSEYTGVTVTARTLAEARMSKGKVPRTRDPLLRTLLERGTARVHTLPIIEDDEVIGSLQTSSVDAVPPRATPHPLSLVNIDGEPDPRILVIGIPAQSTQPGSTIGAAPGVPSPLLVGADIAAEIAIAQRHRMFV